MRRKQNVFAFGIINLFGSYTSNIEENAIQYSYLTVLFLKQTNLINYEIFVEGIWKISFDERIGKGLEKVLRFYSFLIIILREKIHLD